MAHKHSRSFADFVEYLKSRDFQPATIFDVGVCYGTPELQAGFPDAYHVLIEPLSELEERMQALLKKYRGEYHMLALSSEPGTVQLGVSSNAIAGASLAGSGDASRAVPVETLDRLFGDRDDLQGPVLIKTDCQGYDLNVVKGGMEKILPQADVVIMEVNMFHPAGNPALGDFGAIVSWMRENSFAVFDIISYQKRPRDQALGYVDLAFVKEDGRFREQHKWA